MLMLAEIPVPRDILLPLPADPFLLQGLLVVLFLAHILFINLTVGGAVLTAAFQIVGLRRPVYDRLAHELARTTTVNKSMAVVMGVAPLLAINVLYTIHFYSANALTGRVWISIVPVVAGAFLLAYLHKYTWQALAGYRLLHIALGLVVAIAFLLVPLVFLVNINLMLFPEQWERISGFGSALFLPNVWPRYLHFVVACLSVTSLFGIAWFTRAGFPVEQVFEGLSRPALRRIFYRLALVTTFIQLLAGPLVLFTLPKVGMSWWLIGVILTGATLALAAIALIWAELVGRPERIGRFFTPVAGLIMGTALCMGYGRHVYRENALQDHRAAIRKATDDFAWASADAHWRFANNVPSDANLPPGERIFRDSCASCHALDRIMIGPPLREIAEIYAGQPEGIVKWANNPGKKRAGSIAMPPMRIGDQNLLEAARYMLEIGGKTQ